MKASDAADLRGLVTDLDTLVYTYTGDDNVITNVAGTVPVFSHLLLPPLINTGALARCKRVLSCVQLFQQFVRCGEKLLKQLRTT